MTDGPSSPRLVIPPGHPDPTRRHLHGILNGLASKLPSEVHADIVYKILALFDEAQRTTRTPELDRIEKAANMLRREVRGALGVASHDLRDVLGVTNLRALEYWADEVESALAAAKGR